MNEKNVRKGCVDVWNAFMVKGASFSLNDIPFCPTTAKSIPEGLISYSKAKTIYNNHIKNGHAQFFINKFVHFYNDDIRFDGVESSIWYKYKESLNIIRHFAGAITPDFSTYADFPIPVKIYNTYRMRALGYWLTTKGVTVINNVRWGTSETFSYTFDGIPHHSIVAIGASASKLRCCENRALFINGLKKMLEILQPDDILIYGEVNHPEIRSLLKNVRIHCFKSETAEYYQEVLFHEQT